MANMSDLRQALASRALSPEEQLLLEIQRLTSQNRAPASEPEPAPQARPPKAERSPSGMPESKFKVDGSVLQALIGDRSTPVRSEATRLGGDLKHDRFVHEIQTIPPEVFEQIEESARFSPAVIEQDAAIEALEEQMGKAADQKPNLDLTPLASLVDTWTGSKFAQTYKPSGTAEQLKDRLVAYQDKLAERKMQRAALIEKLMELQKGGFSTERLTFGAEALRSEDNTDPNLKGSRSKGVENQRALGNRQKLIEMFRKENQDAIDRLRAADQARRMIDSGSEIAIKAIRPLLARLMGDRGALSDKDLAAYEGPVSIKERALNAFEKAVSGDYTEFTRNEFIALVDVLSAANQAQIEEAADDYITHIAPMAFGVSPQMARDLLVREWVPMAKEGKKGSRKPESKAAEPSSGPLSPSEWLKQKRAKEAQKGKKK